VTAADLATLGFEKRGGALHAPSGASISFIALDGRCFRVRIELPNGGVLHFVVSALALRVEEAAQ